MSIELRAREKISERTYFPQIDGLRFLAFLLVMIHHFHARTDLLEAGTLSHTIIFYLQQVGWIGVDIFLVLSSFLIFTLLMKEKEITGNVKIKRFFIRRALRIWPLYFPYVIFAMVLLPLFWPVQSPDIYQDALSEHLFPFMTFLGNISYAYFPESRTAFFGHMWTICLEEQFYLVVPFVICFLTLRPGRKFWLSVITLLGFTAAVKAYFILNAVPYPMIWVNPFSRFDPFIVGAVCAVLFKHKPDWFRVRYGLGLGLLAVLLIGLAGGFGILGRDLHTVWQLPIAALGGGVLIAAVLSSKILGAVFSFPIVRYLGKISYGLYVFHMIGIKLVFEFLTLVPVLGNGLHTWLLDFALALAITIFISVISYQFYESRFLKLKDKYADILSRPV